MHNGVVSDTKRANIHMNEQAGFKKGNNKNIDKLLESYQEQQSNKHFTL
jgi:hypothetical protein